ncbi:GTP-binding protein of EngA family [Klebsormidium nitens]|uniref:GTPase Der n=1 Tax=Klebsormidium nitens TaxID=105231 RepID=A0A1Y1HNP6_KLENI|nr:GTP-binding protein of EngA family [Klebsormidium nitens]|eukprot:GAQ78236.1 GTP-binding protein of EngA family [Klebsormidium nitens]
MTMLRLPLDKVCKLLFRPHVPSQALQLISATRLLSSKRPPSHIKEVNSSSKKPVQKDTKKKQPKTVRDEDQALLPSVVLVGRPNVGKSALYNRLVRRKEALVYDTPGGHVTRDYREGVAQLSDLRFKLFDTAGMEADSEGGSLLGRAMALTAKLLTRSHLALFMLDARAGVQPMDIELARWLRCQTRLPVILAANKCEGGNRQADYVLAAMGEAYQVGFGEAVAISAESGEGLADLYEKLQPHIDRATANIPAEVTARRERAAAASRPPPPLKSTGTHGEPTESEILDEGASAVHIREGDVRAEPALVQGNGTAAEGESAGEVFREQGLDVRWVQSEGSGREAVLGPDQVSIDGEGGMGSKDLTNESALEAGTRVNMGAEEGLEAEADRPFAVNGSDSVASGRVSVTASASKKNIVELASDTAVDGSNDGENGFSNGMSLHETSLSRNGAKSSPLEEVVESGYGAFTMEEAEGRQRKEAELEAAEAVPLQFAIAGRPNVGKSTLVNFLLGQDRVLTGPEPGLTRDSVQIPFEHNGRPIWLVDTAGWMHRSRLEEGAPQLSAADARKKIMRAHVVALMLDAQEIAASGVLMKGNEVTLASWVLEEGRALIVLVNKIDCLSGPEQRKLTKKLEAELNELLPQARGAPILTLSALKGLGAARLMPKVVSLYDSWKTRLPTSRINRWLQQVEMQMPNKPGYGVRVRYITQIKARPPTFVVFVSGAGDFPASRLRFLASGIRKEFGMEGVPIRMLERRVLRKGGQGTSRLKHR